MPVRSSKISGQLEVEPELAMVFFGAVLGRLLLQGMWTELDTVIFGWIWGISGVVTHLGVFLAEALRGRDAPQAVLGVVIFWVAMLVMWLV